MSSETTPVTVRRRPTALASPHRIAEVYALRNQANETFAWLDRAWISRDPGITHLLYDPFILR